MKRPASNILPLLAGRLRPQRKPPRASGVSAMGPVLRISQGATTARDDSSSRSIPGTSTPPRRTEADHERVVDALRVAEQALSWIQHHVLEIDEVWRRIENEGDVRFSSSTGSSFEESVFRGGQLLIDRHLAAIETAARRAEFAGARLFDGDWSISIELTDGAVNQTFSLPRISINTLGSEKVAGVIALLRSDEDYSVSSGESANARAILRSALFQLSGLCERLENFLQCSVEPSSLIMEIAQENAEAANESMDDAEFVRQLGSITRMDALLASQAVSQPRNSLRNPPQSHLRISPNESVL